MYRSHECATLNKAFTRSHQSFTGCVLRQNSKTASYCYNCVVQYQAMVNNYTTFANGFTNITGNNVTCRSIYFDINPLNIVNTIYKNDLKLWDIAFCKGNFFKEERKLINLLISSESFIIQHFFVFEIDCFDSNCQWDELGSNCNRSTTTIDFEHLHNETTACISHHQYDACTHCNEQYEILNKKYDDIRLQTGDKFCFDIKNLVSYQIISFRIQLG